MSKKKKGRKSLLTPGLRRQICAMLSGAHTIRTVCAALGFGEKSFFTWCENDPTFFTETQRARARGRVRLVESILDSPDWRAKSWYLSVTSPEEFARVAERPVPVDLTQPAAPLECRIIVKEMTAEDRALGEKLMQHPAPPPKKEQNAQPSNGIFEFTRS